MRTQGVIVKNIEVNSTHNNSLRHHSHKSSTTYAMVVQYLVDDNFYTVTSKSSSSTKATIGNLKTVYYNPDNPADAIIDGAGVFTIFLFIGLFFFAIGCVFVLPDNRLGNILTPFILGLVFSGCGAYFIYTLGSNLSTKNYFVIFGWHPLITLLCTAFIGVGIYLLVIGFIPKHPNVCLLELIEINDCESSNEEAPCQLVFLNHNAKIPTMKYYVLCTDSIPAKFENNIGEKYFFDINKIVKLPLQSHFLIIDMLFFLRII